MMDNRPNTLPTERRRSMKDRLKRMLIWYLLLNKRLFKKAGFLVILSLIPILAFLMASAVEKEDSGFMTVALYFGENDAEMISELEAAFDNDNSELFYYKVCETEKEAIALAARAEADAAWVFADDLSAEIDSYSRGNPTVLVKVYEAEENSILMLSREKIFASLYPHISYRMYDSYIDEEIVTDIEITEEMRRDAYNIFNEDKKLIDFRFLDADPKQADTPGFLISPLSGMFAILMLLCGLASTMYFINDEQKGTFNWLLPKKRAAVLWTSNFCAVTVAGIFSTVALILSGNYTNFGTETLMMLLYILAASSFCTLVGSLIPSQRAFGIILPIVLVACLVFCPIFFELKGFGAIQALLPPYYYLSGRFDMIYALYSLIYIALSTLAAYGIYVFRHRQGD